MQVDLTEEEVEFLYNLLDNIQVAGVRAVKVLNQLIEKVEVHYTPPAPVEEPEE
tara:strand:- start:29 stop:190 length:162 start_codon:yes stop_codon:yes gene_type:complete